MSQDARNRMVCRQRWGRRVLARLMAAVAVLVGLLVVMATSADDDTDVLYLQFVYPLPKQSHVPLDSLPIILHDAGHIRDINFWNVVKLELIRNDTSEVVPIGQPLEEETDYTLRIDLRDLPFRRIVHSDEEAEYAFGIDDAKFSIRFTTRSNPVVAGLYFRGLPSLAVVVRFSEPMDAESLLAEGVVRIIESYDEEDRGRVGIDSMEYDEQFNKLIIRLDMIPVWIRLRIRHSAKGLTGEPLDGNANNKDDGRDDDYESVISPFGLTGRSYLGL